MNAELSEAELRDLLDAGYRYACALRVSQPDAQDLVHEAWIKVVRAYGPSPSRAVLLRSIRNLHIDHYRHLRRYHHVPLEDEAHSVQDVRAASDVMDVGDPQLNRCLARLRDDEREVLFLSVVEGYTAEEIASMTKRPRGTILSMVHRARIKLKNYIMEDESQASGRSNRRQLK